MLHLAFHPSLHGTWVARYAIRLAAHQTPPRLAAWQVALPRATLPGGPGSTVEEEASWGRLEDACHWQQTQLVEHRVTAPSAASAAIAQALGTALPSGRDEFLVCGTRSQPCGGLTLRASVAEHLLADRRRPTLALHVVHPGLLGTPREVLIPLAGHPRGLADLLPWLQLLGDDASRLHLLIVASGRGHWRAPRRALTISAARDYLTTIEREGLANTPLARTVADVRVVVAQDAARVILNAARQLRVGLILLGASQRSWLERLWRGDPIENILREAPCDVGIYRGPPP
ncbi:MAG: universal stress protein [Pirellulales bacterium]